MSPSIAPLSYSAPIGRTKDGVPVYGERAFMDYVAQQVFLRIGGATAPSNTELDEMALAAQTLSQSARAQADQRSAVHALAGRVAELEAQVLALFRTRISDRGLDDLQTFTYGTR